MISFRGSVLFLLGLCAGFPTIRAEQSPPDWKYLVVTGNKLRMRESASLSSKPIGSLNKWDVVEKLAVSTFSARIDGLSSSWYKIRTSSNTEGWVFGGYITQMAIVDDGGAPLYATSNLSAAPIGKLSARQPVFLMDGHVNPVVESADENPWITYRSFIDALQVKDLSGQIGWVSTTSVNIPVNTDYDFHPCLPKIPSVERTNNHGRDENNTAAVTAFFNNGYLDGRFDPGLKVTSVGSILSTDTSPCNGRTGDAYLWGGVLTTKVIFEGDCTRFGVDGDFAVVGNVSELARVERMPILDKAVINRYDAAAKAKELALELDQEHNSQLGLPRIYQYEIPSRLVFLAQYSHQFDGEGELKRGVFFIDGKSQDAGEYYADVQGAFRVGQQIFFLSYASPCWRCDGYSYELWELQDDGKLHFFIRSIDSGVY